MISQPVISQPGISKPGLVICEKNMRGFCCLADTLCPHHHMDVPYMWQVHMENEEAWTSLVNYNEEIEKNFADPSKDNHVLNIQVSRPSDGVPCQASLYVSFGNMSACLSIMNSSLSSDWWAMTLRRLSTPSYADGLGKHGAQPQEGILYSTQWRWYYRNNLNNSWKLFGEDEASPLQSTMECKFFHRQAVYKFDSRLMCKGSHEYLINFDSLIMTCLTMSPIASSQIKRRPLFISQQQMTEKMYLLFPPMKVLSYALNIPEDWSPVDPKQGYELIPLNPESAYYDMIASEFNSSLNKGSKINDIFRVQNPFLWQKYCVRRNYMEEKKKGKVEEVAAYHGTSDESAVQAILSANFDPRCSGKNATVYGEGSYFARSAHYSDKYTGPDHVTKASRWMFLARILPGKMALGQKGLRRPPPIDRMLPNGDLYDSCVDVISNPNIYVIFDSDQCYPEYLICYARD